MDFGRTAKGLSRNPLGIIALFIVLVYGITALVLVASNQLQTYERSILIGFLVIFPFVVFSVFIWLVIHHHEKLYAPSDFKNEEIFLALVEAKKDEISMIAETNLKIAYILADGSSRWGGVPPEHLAKIKEFEKEIGEFLSNDFEDEIKAILVDLDKKIKKRIENEKNH